MYGEGEVVSKAVSGNEIYVRVRFSDGKELALSTQAFTTGFASAEGELKEEIQAVADRKAAAVKAETDKLKEMTARVIAEAKANGASGRGSVRKARRPMGTVTASGSLQEGYAAYLEAAAYRVITPSGSPSTVPQYVKAIELVLDIEHITWEELEKDIAYIVPKYDVGGCYEDVGNKSNRTVINALKRFQEYVSA